MGVRNAAAAAAFALLSGCATPPPPSDTAGSPALQAFVEEASATSVRGTEAAFVGSPYTDVGMSGLFPVRGPQECSVAVLQNGEDSLAVRLATLKAAQKSIRI